MMQLSAKSATAKYFLKQWNGFTLIELLATLTIAALVAGLAVISMGDTTLKAQLESETQRIRGLDDHIRTYSLRTSSPSTLQIDIDNGTIKILAGNDDSRLRTEFVTRRVSLKRFLSSTNEISNGIVDIHYDSHGKSETFAIELTANKLTRWLLFSGITGKVTQFEARYNVEDFFQLQHTDGIVAN